MQRFSSPNVAEAILTADEQSMLAPHRRGICIAFLDLRGFTAFTDAAEPEEVTAVLRECHAAMGLLVTRCESTLDRFAGGILICFNDPFPVLDPGSQASRRRRIFRPYAHAGRRPASTWISASRSHKGSRRFGVFGFEGRQERSAIGSDVNLAARLRDEAPSGQIFIDRRTLAALGDDADVTPIGPLQSGDLRSPSRPTWSAGSPTNSQGSSLLLGLVPGVRDGRHRPRDRVRQMRLRQAQVVEHRP